MRNRVRFNLVGYTLQVFISQDRRTFPGGEITEFSQVSFFIGDIVSVRVGDKKSWPGSRELELTTIVPGSSWRWDAYDGIQPGEAQRIRDEIMDAKFKLYANERAQI